MSAAEKLEPPAPAFVQTVKGCVFGHTDARHCSELCRAPARRRRRFASEDGEAFVHGNDEHRAGRGRE